MSQHREPNFVKASKSNKKVAVVIGAGLNHFKIFHFFHLKTICKKNNKHAGAAGGLAVEGKI